MWYQHPITMKISLGIGAARRLFRKLTSILARCKHYRLGLGPRVRFDMYSSPTVFDKDRKVFYSPPAKSTYVKLSTSNLIDLLRLLSGIPIVHYWPMLNSIPVSLIIERCK